MSLPLTRAEAWDLFCEWTSSESLRRHVLAVEACMRAYAERFGEDEERWGLVGMLHDLDYERYPDFETGHPRFGMAELERLGFPGDMVRAVASHADYLDVPRETPMEKTLYAVDELSGFVLACAYVRPTGLEGLTAKSVKKKMKTPAFAAAVDREALRQGAAELGVDFDEHVDFVIAALQPHAAELGLGAARQPADG
jgi:putative nucleotidyltransferase with HDIG domain